MGARDVQTNLTIAMQTKGFDKGLREMLNTSQKGLDSMRKQAAAYGKVEEQLGKMEKKVLDLSKIQIDAARAMESIQDKSSDAFKSQESNLKKAASATKILRQEMKLLAQTNKSGAQAQTDLARGQQQALRQQQQAQQGSRWAGTQGFMQGAGVGGMAGMFMQRGPGFGRQFIGQQAGGMLRRAGGAAQGLAFGGVGGIQQAMQAIPGGGMMAGQLGAVAGFSGQALEWQKQRVQLGPMFGADEGMVTAGGRQINQAGRIRKAVRGQGRMDIAQSGDIYREGATAARANLRINAVSGIGEEALSAAGEAGGLAAIKRKRDQRLIRTQIADEMEKAGQKQIGGATLSPFRKAGRAGREMMGVGRQEAAQFTGQFYQAGGGQFTGGASQVQGLKTAMAAQTMYGVGADVSGSFLMGERRGGLVGGRGKGKGAESITGTIKDAFEMGLRESEITKYMQQVAAGIQEFQQTGIPMNKDTIKSMATEMGGAGIGGTRGAAMASGLQRHVQSMGQRGIKSGMDLMALQELGGYKGRGDQDYLDAILRLEQMDIKGTKPGDVKSGGALSGMVKRLVREGGGGIAGMAHMASGMRQLGMQGAQGEFSLLAEKAAGISILSPEQRKAFRTTTGEEGGKGGPKTQEELRQAAFKQIGALGPNLRKQASLMDQQLALGANALGAVQNLETFSVNLNKSFSTTLMPKITELAEKMAEISGIIADGLKTDGGWLSIFKKASNKIILGT